MPFTACARAMRPQDASAASAPSTMAPNGKFSRPFLGAMTPLQDVIGIITPAALHYYDSHGYLPPDIDPKEHRLLIHGMVDRPMIFTLDDLKRLPSVTRTHFIECNANGTTAGHGGVSRKRRPRSRTGSPVAAFGPGWCCPASSKWWA